MATGEGQFGGRQSFLTKLLTPRWISIIALVLGGAAVGDLAYRFLPWTVYVYACTLAAPMCMAVAVAAWSMREKVDQTFDPDYLDAAEYERSRFVVRDLRVRSMALASLATICAGLAGGPALAAQQLHAIWEWMAIASGIGLGVSGVCFQVAFYWEEQLRGHHERLVAASKDQEERAQMTERLRRSILGSASWGSGWTEPIEEKLTRPH